MSPTDQPEQLKVDATLQGMGRKVTTPLEYPAHLDMHSYLSSTVLKQRYAMRGHVAEPAGESGDAPPAGKHSLYELYAVVCHKGNIQVTKAWLVRAHYHHPTASSSKIGVCLDCSMPY